MKKQKKQKKAASYKQVMHAASQIGNTDNYFKHRFAKLSGIHEAMSLIARTPNAVLSPEVLWTFQKEVAKVRKELIAHCDKAFDLGNEEESCPDWIPY